METDAQAVKEQPTRITIPAGAFFHSGNCSDCDFWEPGKRDNNGRAYCAHYGHYYHASERQGCLSHSR